MLANLYMYMFFLGVQPKRNYGGDFKTWKELDAINKSTMDHLPKPSGSWQEGYRAKDSKANIAFGVSVVLFVLTLVEVRNSYSVFTVCRQGVWMMRIVIGKYLIVKHRPYIAGESATRNCIM